MVFVLFALVGETTVTSVPTLGHLSLVATYILIHRVAWPPWGLRFPLTSRFEDRFRSLDLMVLIRALGQHFDQESLWLSLAPWASSVVSCTPLFFLWAAYLIWACFLLSSFLLIFFFFLSFCFIHLFYC